MKYLKTFESYDGQNKVDEGWKDVVVGAAATVASLFNLVNAQVLQSSKAVNQDSTFYIDGYDNDDFEVQRVDGVKITAEVGNEIEGGSDKTKEKVAQLIFPKFSSNGIEKRLDVDRQIEMIAGEIPEIDQKILLKVPYGVTVINRKNNKVITESLKKKDELNEGWKDWLIGSLMLVGSAMGVKAQNHAFITPTSDTFEVVGFSKNDVEVVKTTASRISLEVTTTITGEASQNKRTSDEIAKLTAPTINDGRIEKNEGRIKVIKDKYDSNKDFNVSQKVKVYVPNGVTLKFK